MEEKRTVYTVITFFTDENLPVEKEYIPTRQQAEKRRAWILDNTEGVEAVYIEGPEEHCFLTGTVPGSGESENI